MNKYLLVHFQLDFLNLYNEDSKTLVFAIDISIIFGSLFIYCQTKYIKLRTNFSSKFVSLELRKTLKCVQTKKVVKIFLGHKTVKFMRQ